MDRMTKKAMLMGLGAITIIGITAACICMKSKMKNIGCLNTNYDEY